MRRLEYIMMLLLTSLFFLSGCQREANDVNDMTSGGEKIKIWAWDENYNVRALQIAIDKYNDNHPETEFEIVTMSQEETVAKLNTALLMGDVENLPDIVLIEDYRIQKLLQEYTSSFTKLNDIASSDDFAEYKSGIGQLDGNLYGIPFDSGVAGLFYRIDYIEKAGFSEEDMLSLTWDDYIRIGEKVREDTGHYMLALNPNDLPIIRIMLQSEESWYTDADGNPCIADNQVLKEAVRIYTNIVESEIAKPISDWNQFIKSFQSGETASIISGSWVSSSILEATEQSGYWRVAPIPSMSISENEAASSVGGSGWYVMNGTENTQKAKMFLKETFASDISLLNELIKQINLVSALKKSFVCEKYYKGVEFYGGQTVFKDFYRWMELIPSVNYGNATYEIEQYIAGAIQSVLAGESVDKALIESEKNYLQK